MLGAVVEVAPMPDLAQPVKHRRPRSVIYSMALRADGPTFMNSGTNWAQAVSLA